ncbi:transcript variant X1 [Nothobranchius furzeri]|nr:transcript variant X1 [Nothobranchius furzeri]
MHAVNSTIEMNAAATDKQPSAAQSPLNCGTKKKKVLSAASRESKIKYDKRRSGTRLSVGYALEEWRLLQLDLGLKKDADMAHFLVASYRKKQPPETGTRGCNLKRTSTPRKRTAAKISHRLSPIKPVSECQPSSCIVHGCGKKSEPYVRTLHQFPEDLETVKVWKEFVQKTTTEWDGQVSPWKKICSEHFEPSCYANHTAWLMRSVQKLELRDEFQVPTIYPTEETSSHDAGSLDQPQQAAVGGIEPTRIPESPSQNTKVVEGNAQQPTTLQLPPELHQTPLSVPSFCVTPLVLYTAPATPYQVQPGLTGSVNVVGEKSWKSKGCQTESVTFADGNCHIIKPRLPKAETAEDTYSRDSDVCDEDEDVSRRFRMSELFMECVEEELEPWQKQVPRVDLIEDDDDEPIFVGVLSDIKTDEPDPAPQNKMVAVTDLKSPQPVVAPAPMVMPMTVPATQGKTAPSILTTVAPQPVIVNNQGFIVATPQLANSTEFLATLGAQYPPGTSFTIVPAPQQQQMFHHVPSAAPLPSAIHRPQVQQIRNNVVTLSHVQSPALFSTQTSQQQAKRPIAQLVKTTAVKPATVKDINIKDQSFVRQGLPSKEVEPVAKKSKLDSAKVMARTDNGLIKCPKCPEGFFSPEAQKIHIMNCHGNVESQTPNLCGNKLIMRVSDFYYGRFEGFAKTQETEKTNVSFKCQSCLKILKNNIRFMNHMKHHLELEKQNSESWDSHTTCQHCYRQYLTPFQLQCHIESAHSPIESSTNCKICELAFESEQVLLEHMKGNHKPGEMPYVCQVCNYRSSFFSDVESHFRTAHVNTKDLLCPFCLKIARSSHVYMQHYMKHQKKGIYRCGKCRLNFLTYKEKVDHRAHGHKTYRRPEALEGLPPGTKVTIRASLTGTSSSTPLPSDRAAITVYSEALNVSQFKPPVSLLKAKINEPKEGKRKAVQSKTKKEDRRISQNNLSLKDLSVGKDHYTCIECNADVDDFFLHFPIFSHCGACSYRTSCKVSIGNHMIKYHSTISKNRYNKKDHKKNVTVAGFKLTLICVNCELLVDASSGDLMTKHLTDNPDHVCKIVQEKGVVESRSRLSSQQPLVEKLKESDLKPAFADVGPTDDHKKDSEETSSQNESKSEMSSLPNVSSSISSDLGLNL